MITAKQLKTETEAILKARGYPINLHLPQIEELAELSIASSLDVRRRCLVLSAVCARAYGAPYELVAPWIEKYGLKEHSTAAEMRLLASRKPTEDEKAPFWPQPDALWEFAWILKMMPPVDHFRPCSNQLVHMFPKPGEDVASFLASAEIQEAESLFREADRVYRIHWAVREVALKGRTSPTGQSENVTRHRLQAINWTTRSGVDWDHVDVST